MFFIFYIIIFILYIYSVLCWNFFNNKSRSSLLLVYWKETYITWFYKFLLFVGILKWQILNIIISNKIPTLARNNVVLVFPESLPLFLISEDLNHFYSIISDIF